MNEPISFPWRALKEGKLLRWLDNGEVWEPGGIPIWRSADELLASWPDLTPVPWPIVGYA